MGLYESSHVCLMLNTDQFSFAEIAFRCQSEKKRFCSGRSVKSDPFSESIIRNRAVLWSNGVALIRRAENCEWRIGEGGGEGWGASRVPHCVSSLQFSPQLCGMQARDNLLKPFSRSKDWAFSLRGIYREKSPLTSFLNLENCFLKKGRTTESIVMLWSLLWKLFLFRICISSASTFELFSINLVNRSVDCFIEMLFFSK